MICTHSDDKYLAEKLTNGFFHPYQLKRPFPILGVSGVSFFNFILFLIVIHVSKQCRP